MVDMKTDTKSHNHQGHEKAKVVNPRTAIREARARRMRLVSGGKPQTIKVYAANEDMRAVLRHPSGIRFRETLDQPVEWPNDSFTARRIAEGAVRTDGAGSAESAEVDESLNPRQQAAAFKAQGTKGSKSEHEPKTEAKSAPKSPQPAA
jgi:hypothetical protein